MATQRFLTLLFCILVALPLTIGCNSQDSTSPLGPHESLIPPYEKPNQPPVINCFNCSESSVVPATLVNLTVDAFDPNGDELTYEYSISGGNCVSNCESACWTLPEQEGLYKAYVVVSDGFYKTIEEVEIDVRENPILPMDR
ncbi:MAG: hypothetical protein DWP97_04070 [Calditrichaeota bacterium]|nr:MAG: hypothetical protein DWP97_04070 [Calditrichota bacterium]